MAKFTFGKEVDIHWNGYEIVGPALTEFTIPDQLYEEFESDFRAIEPSLTWIDTNEFATLSASVSASTLSATSPISITTTSTGRNISFSSGTALNGYLLAADGSGGAIWNPASTSGLTSVVGVSPISSAVSGGVVSVSLTGTYVNAVVGTSPASVSTASGTSTVSIDQAAITGATAATNAQVVRFYVKNTTGTTIPKGSAVYVSGATGDNALISLASATSEVTSSKTLGITAEAIANDAFGYVIESGYLTDIDTSATTAGAAVWLGNTPGSLVFVSPPSEPSHSVYLGVVVRVQSQNGSILVKVQNGYELNELHDVFTTGVSTALPLVYSSASSGWVAQAVDSVGIADNAVVAAKINAGAVGTAKIDSGAATNGQVLTANGTGGASFASLVSSSMAITYNSVSTTLVSCSVDSIDYAGATATGTFSVAMAVDTASNIAYQIAGRNILRKIDLTANTEMARLTVTATANERLTDVAFGASKIICVSGPTAALGSSQYFIIDPSNLTVENTGNIKEAANYVSTISIPTAKYDSLLGQFTIHSTYTTVTTGVSAAALDTRATFRIVDPSTYSTRVHTFTTAEESPITALTIATSYANGTFMSHPIWYDTASIFISHRISGGGTTRNFRYYSDSAASTGFLTLAGSSVVGGFQGNIAASLVMDPTTSKASIYAAVVDTVNRSLTAIGRMAISTISADFASTGVTTRNFSDVANSASVNNNAPQYPTQSVYPVYGAFNVFLIDGTVYVLAGTELYDANLDNKYGNYAFVSGALSGSANVLNYGNVIHLYKDGTDIKAIVSRRGSTTSGVHIKRLTYSLATADLTILDGTNSSPAIIARSVLPSVTTVTGVNGRYSTDAYLNSNQAGAYGDILQGIFTSAIYFANNSTQMYVRFWPIFGSNETMSIAYWKVS